MWRNRNMQLPHQLDGKNKWPLNNENVICFLWHIACFRISMSLKKVYFRYNFTKTLISLKKASDIFLYCLPKFAGGKLENDCSSYRCSHQWWKRLECHHLSGVLQSKVCALCHSWKGSFFLQSHDCHIYCQLELYISSGDVPFVCVRGMIGTIWWLRLNFDNSKDKKQSHQPDCLE